MRIGELAATAGTTPKTLRYYESVGLLPPPQRTLNGYRDYPEHVISRLDFIGGARARDYRLPASVRSSGFATTDRHLALTSTRSW